MGGTCGSKRRLHAKKKQYKKARGTKRRAKDVDQIQDELRKEQETGQPITFEYDEDLPGGGQHYCVPCARHFPDEGTKSSHERSKVHKRRLKDVRQEQYTQDEAERAAGMSKEVLPPAHGGGAAMMVS